jgi:hypothetical protein
LFPKTTIFLLPQLDILADEISLSADERFDHMRGLLTTLSTTITVASLAENGTQWPMFTHDEFNEVGKSFLENTAAPLVAWSPIVAAATEQNEWESYSASSIRPPDEAIFSIPVWQMESETVDSTTVNFDIFSHELLKPNFEALMTTRAHSLSDFVNSTDVYGIYKTMNDEQSAPESLLMVPLFGDLSSIDANIEGVVLAVIPWDRYFTNVFHDSMSDLDVVVSDGNCGNKYTFSISGPEVAFVGKGDLHDNEYSSSAKIRKFNLDTHTVCQFSFTLFPSQSLSLEYNTTTPVLPIIGMTIGFSIIFILYDALLRKREQKVVTSAARSNAIVSALFPGEFRDRLFGRAEKPAVSTTNLTKIIPESTKFRLKSYLAKGMSFVLIYHDHYFLPSSNIF